jgi:hypothetical protein
MTNVTELKKRHNQATDEYMAIDSEITALHQMKASLDDKLRVLHEKKRKKSLESRVIEEQITILLAEN